MRKITPCLWFDGDAEQAAEFYVSVFKDGKITSVTRAGGGGMNDPGSVLAVSWEVQGQAFSGLNGGPQFPFTEAVSFQINCSDQAEVDHYWSSLTAGGGSEVQCGWCKDRFGLSWQVVPNRLYELLSDKDPGVVTRVTEAMMQMIKLDQGQLEAAAAAT